MFNFFRRKRGSLDDLVDLPDKMLDEEIRLPDENQNTDRDCVIGGDARVGCLLRPETGLSQSRKSKKVRWAENMEQVQEADSTSLLSSSEDETEEQTAEEEEEEDTETSEEESQEEESSGEEEESKESEEEDEEEEKIETESIQSPHLEELNQLKTQLGQIDRDMTAKSSLIDRLQTELREAYQDAELAKYKMSNLQLELEETKQNLEQAQNHESETESDDEGERAVREERLRETEERISHLEQQLKQVIKDKEDIESNLSQIVSERDQRINDIQRAYDDALREQDEMIAKFEEDFEELRTLHSRREQQLLDDFEWKLREVEKNCKIRVEKKDRDKDHEIAELVCKLAETNVQLQEAKKLEVCKVELEQTLKASSELKRNLRTTNRRLEEVQVNEKVLQEETSRLRTQLDKQKSFVTNLQTVHREDLDERERKMNFRLDSQKNLLNSEWEDRLKRDTRQLKQEMERRAREETKSAVEQVRKQMEKTIALLRNEQEEKSKKISLETKNRIREGERGNIHLCWLAKEVEELKKKLSEEELDHKEALENVQSRSDTELMELRRKMEKLYMSYEEKIEKLNEQHEQQIGRVQDDCDKRIQQIESNLQMHAGTTRTTVELVKEQLHRENQIRLQQLENQHQRQLEEQWIRMNRDKEEALRQQENKHKELVKQIQVEMEQLKKYTSRYQQKDKTDVDITSDKSTCISNSQLNIPSQAQSQSSPDKTNAQQSIRAELGEAEASLVREKERLADLTLKAKMCQTIQQLTLQLESSKKEIDSLNSRLRIRSSGVNPPVSEAIHPLTPEPPAPPPRSRGRHSAANTDGEKANAQVKDSIPTAKVQPQNFVKDNDVKTLQSDEPVEDGSSMTAKIQEEQPTPPGIRVQSQPNQQSYNQSRRSRKHRSRRH